MYEMTEGHCCGYRGVESVTEVTWPLALFSDISYFPETPFSSGKSLLIKT